jgi:AraC-like DNA-binding protein
MTRANQTCAACLQSQQRLEAAAILGPKTVQCYAGLSETAVPVRIGQTVLGYLQTGQVFLRTPSKHRLRTVDRFIRHAGLGVDLSAWKTAYFKTRTIAPKQYASIVRLLTIFAEHLATVSNQLVLSGAVVEPLAVTRVRTYIIAHHGEALNLHDAARMANMNACHFCRIFKKFTGLTFTAFLSRTRIESVKRQLLNVHLRISEAAYAAGFQSLSQFNRVFRDITGETPGHYREQLHRLAPAVPRRPHLARAG